MSLVVNIFIAILSLIPISALAGKYTVLVISDDPELLCFKGREKITFSGDNPKKYQSMCNESFFNGVNGEAVNINVDVEIYKINESSHGEFSIKRKYDVVYFIYTDKAKNESAKMYGKKIRKYIREISVVARPEYLIFSQYTGCRDRVAAAQYERAIKNYSSLHLYGHYWGVNIDNFVSCSEGEVWIDSKYSSEVKTEMVKSISNAIELKKIIDVETMKFLFK